MADYLTARAQGLYFTGDGCRRDERGYYTITGRVDDVINVSGHRVGTAEVEAALSAHGACIEAAVVGCAVPPFCWFLVQFAAGATSAPLPVLLAHALGTWHRSRHTWRASVEC